MFSSSKRAACFPEEAVGKTEKTGIDTDEEGAAEWRLMCLFGELHVQTGMRNAAQGEKKNPHFQLARPERGLLNWPPGFWDV